MQAENASATNVLVGALVLVLRGFPGMVALLIEGGPGVLFLAVLVRL